MSGGPSIAAATPPCAVQVYVGIGANLGQVREVFSDALRALDARAGIAVRATSGLYATEPVGGPPDQPPFLNAVIELEVRLTAPELLEVLLAVELEFARERTVRWGPRTLDLDLLLYGDARISAAPELIVPHPRIAERAFVLVPLADLNADLLVPDCDPGSGDRPGLELRGDASGGSSCEGCTVAELMARLSPEQLASVRLLTRYWD